MREKHSYFVLTFDTTTAAMAFEEYCGREQVGGRMIPIPSEFSAGCGLAWRMLPEEWERTKEQLESSGRSFHPAGTIRAY